MVVQHFSAGDQGVQRITFCYRAQPVKEPWTGEEWERFQISVPRGLPCASPGCQEQLMRRLGLEHTVRREGRPSRQVERENPH